MKKTMLFMAALGLVALQACHKVIDTGTCGVGDDGSNLTWTLTDDGTLTISGIGDMANYEELDNSTSSPFWAMRALIRTVVIEKGVASIGELAFAGCMSMTSVVLPDGMTNIGESAFFSCTDLTSVTIPESVMDIGYGAFEACTSLTSVVLPDGIKEIWGWIFDGCTSLTSVTIPESVTRIGREAFSNCTSLTSVTIPKSVTGISPSAFSGCTGLTEIRVKAEVPPNSQGYIIAIEGGEHDSYDSSSKFEGVDLSIPVYVPAGSIEAYRDRKWVGFSDFRTM